MRSDDNRFDKSKALINNPAVTVSTIDGAADEIVAQDFPLAKKYSMPQNTDISMLLESVATKKGDAAFIYMANYYRYNKANPGKLKAIHTDKPLRAFGNTIMILHGENELKDMLNAALNELLNSGEIESIISKYETYPGAYYRVNSPYRAPELANQNYRSPTIENR